MALCVNSTHRRRNTVFVNSRRFGTDLNILVDDLIFWIADYVLNRPRSKICFLIVKYYIIL